jgi:hypothetical protein
MIRVKANSELVHAFLDDVDAGWDDLADPGASDVQRAYLTEFDRLSPRDRVIVALRREGLLAREISAQVTRTTGVKTTVAAVRGVLYRFRKAVRAELQRLAEDSRFECCSGKCHRSNGRCARAPPGRRGMNARQSG